MFHDLASTADAGIETDAIALDFGKAFDLVPHNHLITKLINCCINPVLVHWIAAFLSDRSQYVVLGGITTNPDPVTSGVPQGSVLVPVLFLIYMYINDIVDVVHHSSIRLFADDAILYTPITYLSVLHSRVIWMRSTSGVMPILCASISPKAI